VVKRRIAAFCACLIAFLALWLFIDRSRNGYSTAVIAYTENNSHVEYPQISGLKDGEKQAKINKFLKDYVLLGPKLYTGEPFVDFSHPVDVYRYSSGVGFTNKHIASFWYYFHAYDPVGTGSFGLQGYTYRFFCATIDMRTGEKIELTDIMEIDERLINSSDGDMTEPDHNGEFIPIFHQFKDAFEIRLKGEERDAFHRFTAEEAIDMLKDTSGETTWYITGDGSFEFCFSRNFVTIPYEAISDAVYPEYRALLEG
jgi:hypothetical protein